MSNGDGSETKVQYLHPGKAYKYLGITTAPNGSRIEPMKKMMTTYYSFKNNLQAKITHEDAYIALHRFSSLNSLINYHVTT